MSVETARLPFFQLFSVRLTAAYQAYYKAYFQYQAQTQAAKVAEKSKTPSNIEAAQWYRQYSG